MAGKGAKHNRERLNQCCIKVLDWLLYNDIPLQRSNVPILWHLVFLLFCVSKCALSFYITSRANNIDVWVFLINVVGLVFRGTQYVYELNNHKKSFEESSSNRKPPSSPYQYKAYISFTMLVVLFCIPFISLIPNSNLSTDSMFAITVYISIIFSFVEDMYRSLVLLYDATYKYKKENK